MFRPRWSALARKEARTLVTSKGTWLLAALVVVVGWRPSYVGWDGLGPDVTAGFVQVGATGFLPLGVLLLSFASVVRERNSGSLKFLLGLPLTRTDVLLGKVAGRSVGIAIPISVAAVILGAAGAVRYGLFSPLPFVGVYLATMLYVVALVAIATAVSALTTSTVRASAVVFGVVYLVVTLFWDTVALTAYGSATGRSISPYSPPPDGPLFLLVRLSPEQGYHVVTNWILGVGNSGATYSQVLGKLTPGISYPVFVVEATFPLDSAPAYLHEVSGLVVLALWIVVPLGIARHRFERGDLV